MKNSKKNFLSVCVLMLLVLSVFLLVFVKNNNGIQTFNTNCTSVFHYKDVDNGFEFVANAIFRFSKVSKSSIELSGTIIKDGNQYSILRSYFFNYKEHGGDSYIIYGLKNSVTPIDTSPDYLIDNFFFSRDKDGERVVFINKFDNAYLFSNSFSPVIICVEK